MKLPFWYKPKQPINSAPSARETIVPRIKTTKMLTYIASLGVPAEQMPVTEPLVGDLVVSYAFDLPKAFQIFMGHDLSRLGIQPGELRVIAIANLKRQLHQIGHAPEGDEGLVHRVYTGGNLEACTLLAESWWSDMAAEMQSLLVASAPTRDVVLFCNGQSERATNALKSRTALYYRSETTHALSEEVFVWRGGWVLF